MKISAVQNFNVTPIFASRDIFIAQKSRHDYFERNKNDILQNKLYSNIEASLGIVDETDVANMAKRISKSTKTDIKDVYNTMLILSEYSSIKSLKTLENQLKEDQLKIISNLIPYYDRNDITCIPNLTNVLHYISLSNFGFYKDTEYFSSFKKALFIDSNLIKMLENMPKHDFKIFKSEYLQNKDIKLYYIENFENGYNFLNQGESFEKFTIDLLNKAKILQKHNGGNIEKNLKYILNKRNYIDMCQLGIKPVIIKKSYPDNKSIATHIKENLNPPIPSKKDFTDIINNKVFGTRESDDFYLDFLSQTKEFISPRKYAKYLQNIHSKINQYLIENKKPSDKVYYLIPSNHKSYVLANYEYFKVNDIKNPNVLYTKNTNSTGYVSEKNKTPETELLLNSLPKDSTVIILDDCAMTGASYIEEVFLYRQIAKNLDKSLNIIFAPLVHTRKAQNLINSCIKEVGRQNQDSIICAKKLNDYKNIVATSVIFPYMGPDTNYDDFLEIYETFLYSKNAHKLPMGDIAKDVGYLPIQK